MNVTYTLIIGAALAVGFLAARLTQSKLPMSRRDKLGICLGAYCGAMLGAKLPFVLSDWEGFVSGVAWFSSGKTILCGLVGGYFGVEIAKWTLGVHVKTGDTFAVPVPLSIGVGRLGCFFAGCCYGTPTELPWGVVFHSVDGLARHPTQLYETLFHFSCAGALAMMRDRGLFRGQLIKLYIIVYAGYRFVTETIRPEAKLWHGFTGYQGAALVIMALFAWLWWRDVHASAAPNANEPTGDDAASVDLTSA